MTTAKRQTATKTSSTHLSHRRAVGQLLFVATPIGNLGDITLRALETLKECDAIACEDTRHTQKLLTHYGIKKPLVALHDHNEGQMAAKLVARVQKGEVIAVVSDAGMPLVADPGYQLMQAAIAGGVATSVLPGANAALMGLSLSGLPTDSFTFVGFLPPKAGARQERLAKLAAIPITTIFYESPQRLTDTLAEMAKIWGDRPAAVARELTKRFEDVQRGTLSELHKHYTAHEPKGEIVLIVGGATAQAAPAADIDDLLRDALQEHGVKQAAQIVAAQTGGTVRDIYARALALKGKR